MIPLKDDVPSRTVPFITLILVGLNVVVFFYQLSLQVSPEPGAQRASRYSPATGTKRPCLVA